MRSTSRGAPRPTTSASLATRCSAARMRAARATRFSRPQREPRRPTRIRASPRQRRTATRFGRPTQPGTSGRSRTAQQLRRLLRRTRRPRRRPARSRRTRSAPVRSISPGAPPRQRRRHRVRGLPLHRGCVRQLREGRPDGGGTTTYSDTGLTAATSYSYEVRALDAAGNTGPFSNTVVSGDVAVELERRSSPRTASTRGRERRSPTRPGTATAASIVEHHVGCRLGSTAGRSRSTVRTHASTSPTRRRCS